jgi:hypothetical protein
MDLLQKLIRATRRIRHTSLIIRRRNYSVVYIYGIFSTFRKTFGFHVQY